MNSPKTLTHSLTCNAHVFDLNARPCLMGILNVTPDSFSDGGLYLDQRLAIEHGLNLAAQGADIIDVGGESTRPGSRPVDADEEMRRVLPVVQELAGRAGLAVSIDTMKAAVARRALEAGACMVNDVSALKDPDMAAVVADADVPVVLMHMSALPGEMQQHTAYDDIVADIRRFLEARIAAAVASGIAPHNIIIDPGIGFGKSLDEGNFTLLARLREFTSLGHPILIGASRKAFIGKIVGDNTHARDAGTAAAVTAAVLGGAHIIRAHNVAMMRAVALVAHRIARFQSS
jgi:dihydropteroate synthase